MKKIVLSLIAIIGFQQISMAQQPMTISPGLVVSSPTAGTSGLRFTNLNSGTTASTTPTKVLSLDATGNVILGNVASGSGSSVAINIPVYANSPARSAAIPTPSTGMLTYTSFIGTGPEYFNGTQWLPVNYWTFNSSSSRLTPLGGPSTSIEAGRFISQFSSSIASPVFAFTGPTNTFRFARSGPDATDEAVTQETTAGFQPSTSSIAWNHYVGNTSTPTRLFGFAAGTMTINGFTKLGDEATTTTAGVTKSSPAIKTILLTGSLTLRSNPETSTSLTTTIAHGLDFSKIVDIKVLVYSNSVVGVRLVGEDCVALSGFQFSTYTDGVNVNIIRSSTNSGTIGPNGTTSTATYKILISYIP